MPRHRVFISYSHCDRRHLDRLRVHLMPLERNGLIDVWDDTQLRGGSQWRRDIAAAILQAKVAILLVSADFLASAFIAENELPPLLKAAAEDGATLLPVVVGACRLKSVPELASLQAVNNPSRPLSALPVAERERVWVRVGDAVEASLADRPVSEGWRVANEKPVLEALEALVKDPQETGFLIVYAGDYYVQFLKNRGRSTLSCEAVSDRYLPKALRLSPTAVRRLESLGFSPPTSKVHNFYQSIPLEKAAGSLPSLASLAVRVMAEPFGVSQNTRLLVQLELMG